MPFVLASKPIDADAVGWVSGLRRIFQQFEESLQDDRSLCVVTPVLSLSRGDPPSPEAQS
jgi:hypothetical protein